MDYKTQALNKDNKSILKSEEKTVLITSDLGSSNLTLKLKVKIRKNVILVIKASA